MALSRMFWDEFPGGLDTMDDDFFRTPMMFCPCPQRYLPTRSVSRQPSASGVRVDKEGFHVNLDVQQFKPEEVTVKHTGNNITVEAKHEEKRDEHGYIYRHFVRRYVVPDDVEAERVECKLSSDGILSVNAPKKAIMGPDGKERVIPITQTNMPAVKQAETSAPVLTAKAAEPAKK